MADSFSQLYIQIVFSVARREKRVRPEYQQELNKYITGIVQNKGHKMLAINGMPEHIHIFVGLNPAVAISTLVADIKKNSSAWINHEKRWFTQRFSWQKGYAAFSYSRSAIKNVIRYIENQQEHHKRKSFEEEYIAFLKAFDVKYDERYVFD
jgi:putative transposase